MTYCRSHRAQSLGSFPAAPDETLRSSEVLSSAGRSLFLSLMAEFLVYFSENKVKAHAAAWVTPTSDRATCPLGAIFSVRVPRTSLAVLAGEAGWARLCCIPGLPWKVVQVPSCTVGGKGVDYASLSVQCLGVDGAEGRG